MENEGAILVEKKTLNAMIAVVQILNEGNPAKVMSSLIGCLIEMDDHYRTDEQRKENPLSSVIKNMIDASIRLPDEAQNIHTQAGSA